MRALTTEEFIEKAKAVHGDKYDYSKVDYINAQTKVTIICPKHGEFTQKPYNHLNGNGCPECVRRSWTTEKLVEEIRKVHGDKYDYSKVVFKSVRDKICIISKKNDSKGRPIGEFWKLPLEMLKGTNNPRENYGWKKEEAWEDRVCSICGTSFYVRKKYEKICCSEECRQKYIELHREEINKKKTESMKRTLSKRTDEEKEAIREKIRKTCIAKYGVDSFSKTPEGRKKCSENMKKMKHDKDIKYRDEVLIPKYHNICENDDLELIEFRSRFDCDVRCKKCGNLFNVKVLGYLKPENNTNLCRVCHPVEQITGPTELETTFEDFLRRNNIRYLRNCRRVIYPKEIDFYIPDKKIGFELDGLYWHCETQKPDDYHLKKTEECNKKGIRLIHIFEDEWRDKREICESRVLELLQLTSIKIGARKCDVREVNTKEERKFLDKNHIQGYTPSKYCFGLYYCDELVAIMSFSGLRKNLGYKDNSGGFELLRFCSKNGVSVQGGASKLLKHFIKTAKPENIISYADRRWSNGNMYEKIGMTFVKDTVPNYFYLLSGDRKNRFGFRKNILVSKYGCPEDMTEKEFCFNQHWYRIYDCGSKLYSMNCS